MRDRATSISGAPLSLSSQRYQIFWNVAKLLLLNFALAALCALIFHLLEGDAEKEELIRTARLVRRLNATLSAEDYEEVLRVFNVDDTGAPPPQPWHRAQRTFAGPLVRALLRSNG